MVKNVFAPFALDFFMIKKKHFFNAKIFLFITEVCLICYYMFIHLNAHTVICHNGQLEGYKEFM